MVSNVCRMQLSIELKHTKWLDKRLTPDLYLLFCSSTVRAARIDVELVNVRFVAGPVAAAAWRTAERHCGLAVRAKALAESAARSTLLGARERDIVMVRGYMWIDLLWSE